MSETESLSPRQIADTLSSLAEKKAAATVQEQFFLAILAGMYIGFGAIVATVVSSGGTLDPGLTRFLAGSVFTVGLMLVIIPGSELFTGNILMTVGFLAKRVRPLLIVRNWVVVWIGNFAGALLLAWLLYRTGQLVDAGGVRSVGEQAIQIAARKFELAQFFWPCFFRGVLCNMLVCLAVIMASSARTVSGKIMAIYFPIMTFVTCNFEHSIANMYFLPAGLLAAGEFGSRFWEIFNNLIPVTLGNIVGGLTIILLHPKSQQRIFRRLKDSVKEAH
jgi:formate/nitrite transporter